MDNPVMENGKRKMPISAESSFGQLFFSEQMFKKANLMELHFVSKMGQPVRLEKALDFLSRDKTEIEEATGTLGSCCYNSGDLTHITESCKAEFSASLLQSPVSQDPLVICSMLRTGVLLNMFVDTGVLILSD